MNSPFVDIYFHFQKFNLKWADFKDNELEELKNMIVLKTFTEKALQFLFKCQIF